MPDYPQKRRLAANASGIRLVRGGLVGLLVALAPVGLAQSPSAAVPSSPASLSPELIRAYRLAPGDELSVTFPYNHELNHDGPVGPDGHFTLPLIGNLALAGDTINEASAAISKALRDAGIVENAYPELTVVRYGANVYVGGQVKRPGVVQLVSGMDALEAIIAAGGLTDGARTGEIAIIRRTGDGPPRIVYVDVKAFTQGKPGPAIALLEPHDILFVPRSKIAEVDLWVDNYINKALPFSRGVTYSYGNYPVDTVVK